MSTDTPSAHLRPLAACVVDVWRVPLRGADEATLSTAEWTRANRRRGDERRRFVASHAATRAIAATYVGVSPAELRLDMPYGEKPRLVAAGLELSLAHSGDLALVAVATAAVGVDLERLDDLPDDELEALSEFSLTRSELGAFRPLEHGSRREAFLRLWTRKEAYLKAIGQGLGDRAMAEIEVGLGDVPQRVVTDDHAAPLVALADVDPAPGFVGAVALAAECVAVALRDWDGPNGGSRATLEKPTLMWASPTGGA